MTRKEPVRQRSEQHTRFLAELGEQLQRLQDPYEVAEVVTRGLGRHLRAERCTLAEIHPDRNLGVVHRDYAQDVPSAQGLYTLTDFPAFAVEALESGHNLVIPDLLADPRTATASRLLDPPLSTRAIIAIPRMRDGRWAAVLLLGSCTPRDWQPEDVSLVRSAADLGWLAIENLRLLQRLRKNEERFQVVLRNSPLSVCTTDRELRYTWLYNWHNEFSLEKVIGKRDEDLMPREGMLELIQAKEEALATGKGLRREIMIRPAGEDAYYDLTVEPLRGPSGEITGLTVTAMDITRRKRTEQEREQLFTKVREISFEIQRQAEELNAIFNSMAEPLLIYDGRGGISKINAAALEAIGFNPAGLSREEIATRLNFQPLVAGPAEEEEWVAEQALRGRVVRDKYYRFRNVQGLEAIILASAAPIRNWEQIQGAVVVWHDMTVQMHIEELAHKSQERYRFLYDESPAFNLIIGQDQTIKDINKSALSALGFTRDALIGKPLMDLVAGEQKSKLAEIVQETIAGRITAVPDVCFKAKDGSLRTIMFSPGRAALYKYYGRVEGIIFTGMDVTERKKTEEALRRAHDELEMQVAERTADLVELNLQLNLEIQERREIEHQVRAGQELLERIFANTNFLIAYMDTRFNFIRVNHVYAHQDRRGADFFIGRNHFELYPDAENQRLFEQVVQSGQPLTVYESSLLYPSHPERGKAYWDWSLQPVKDSAGRVEGLVLCLVDVTKRKRAEQELHATQTKLDKAERLSDIGTLAATVAHELRNPLGVMRTALYNIKRKQLNPELDRHIANIEKKISESDQIINNLLNYSRIKSPQYERVAIRAMLDECLAAAGQAFMRQPVAVTRQYEDLNGLEVDADPVQLREIFNNLLSNAFQAVQKREGEIRVHGRIEMGDWLAIDIIDNGCGIEADNLGRVFDPFFTTKSKGTGLGLTLCKELVHLHGGTIRIGSQKDQGTQVIIHLPLQRPKA